MPSRLSARDLRRSAHRISRNENQMMKSVNSHCEGRLRRPISLALKAVCLAICLASAAPAALAKNDHGDCSGNCEAEPAPAPTMGGGLLGLVILGGGAVILWRRVRHKA
jgi:hypothetical protein